MGLSEVRAGPTAAGSSKLPSSSGIGRSSWSIRCDHAPIDEIHVGDQAVDRVRPRMVLLVVLHEGQHPQHAPALLAGDAERPGRQRAGADQVEVGDAAAGHGLPPAAVGLDDLVDRDQVLEHDRRLPMAGGVEHDRGVDRSTGERGHDVGGAAGGRVEQDRPDTPVDRLAGPEGEHLRLGRLLEPEVGEAGVLADQPTLGQHRPGQADLVGTEPLQRVGRPGRPPAAVALGRSSKGHGGTPHRRRSLLSRSQVQAATAASRIPT